MQNWRNFIKFIGNLRPPIMPMKTPPESVEPIEIDFMSKLNEYQKRHYVAKSAIEPSNRLKIDRKFIKIGSI